MILFGWGRRTVKHQGQISQTCPHCHNTGWFNVVTVRTWFTLFFIPVIPYKVRHVMMCTNCGFTVELDAEHMATAMQAIHGGTPLAALTTPTATGDASYDQQLAEYEEQLAAQRDALARRRAAGAETDADRLRTRMEQRNRNWDDRRS
jgi:zinc-ribbon family